MSLKISKSNFRINPVLLKELKVKMRSWKAAILIGGYVLVFALLTLFIVKITMENNYGGVSQGQILSTYAFMVAAQFGLISLIAPALTAGAISGEREKQTLDILLSTTLNCGSIILGKLFSSLSHIILLIVASVPVFSIIFLYGGIGVTELLQVFLFYIILTVTLGSIGIFFSTFVKKSTAASVLTYAMIVFLYLGTILITVFYVQLVIVPDLSAGGTYHKTFWLVNFNPAIALISMVTDQFGQGSNQVFPGFYLSGEGGLKLWQINEIVNICLSVLLLWLSALKLNPVKRKGLEKW